MNWSSSTTIALAFGIFISSARPISCQQMDQLEMGVRPAAHDSVRATHPSGFSLNAKSIEGSITGSLLGATAGLMVDQAYCQRHHGSDPSFLFGPCSFYANEGFGVGWFGGAIVGSTFAAARVAQKRGCPRGAALLRAAAGAAIGAAPGVSIVARRTGRYPPSRSVVIAATPILAAFGAAAAVIGCRGT